MYVRANGRPLDVGSPSRKCFSAMHVARSIYLRTTGGFPSWSPTQTGPLASLQPEDLGANCQPMLLLRGDVLLRGPIGSSTPQFSAERFRHGRAAPVHRLFLLSPRASPRVVTRAFFPKSATWRSGRRTIPRATEEDPGEPVWSSGHILSTLSWIDANGV